MATPKSIALMITSTCEARIGPSVAALVKSIVENHSDPSGTSLTLVDLVKFNLPVYDEGCHSRLSSSMSTARPGALRSRSTMATS